MDNIVAGDKVKLSADAVYYTGRQISMLIKSKSWIVSSVAGNRVMLGNSTDGYYSLNAPVDIKYLSKVE